MQKKAMTAEKIDFAPALFLTEHFFTDFCQLRVCKVMATTQSLRRKKVVPPDPVMPEGTKLVAQFKTVDGETTGPPLNLPGDVTPDQLELLLNQLLNQVRGCDALRALKAMS